MALHWSEDTISDETYRTKFTMLPKILGDWLSERGGLSRHDVLDFGCGEATTALAIALQTPANRVVGVDIMPDFEECSVLARSQIGLASLPPNLSLHRIRLGYLHNDTDKFDLIYSWSVFEHRAGPGNLHRTIGGVSA
jgi:SAM-dependent methyltransferase